VALVAVGEEAGAGAGEKLLRMFAFAIIDNNSEASLEETLEETFKVGELVRWGW